MRTPAHIARHPLHPMLVTIPIGLWLFSLVSDLAFYLGSGSENWQIVARYTLAGGIVGALIAAVPGLVDLLALPGGLKRIALVHMTINLAVVVLYVANLWLRLRGTEGMTPLALSVIAVLMLFVSGWLGGKLVHVHGVAVETPPEPVPPSGARPVQPASNGP